MFNGNGQIDNFIELLLMVLFILAFYLVLFKIGNWLEELTPREPKKKKEKVKKTVVKEVVKEVKDSSADISSKSSSSGDVSVDVASSASSTDSTSLDVGRQNYLYDRFVVAPSREDNIQVKNNDTFIDEDEATRLRDEKLKIKVQDVVDISSPDLKKNSLYARISQMASENLQAKEKLLEEFESLPREMKLLLINNIIQKM